MAEAEKAKAKTPSQKETFWSSQRTRVGLATVIAVVLVSLLRAQFPLIDQYLTAEQFSGLVQAISIIVGSWLLGRSLRNTPSSK